MISNTEREWYLFVNLILSWVGLPASRVLTDYGTIQFQFAQVKTTSCLSCASRLFQFVTITAVLETHFHTFRINENNLSLNHLTLFLIASLSLPGQMKGNVSWINRRWKELSSSHLLKQSALANSCKCPCDPTFVCQCHPSIFGKISQFVYTIRTIYSENQVTVAIRLPLF